MATKKPAPAPKKPAPKPAPKPTGSINRPVVNPAGGTTTPPQAPPPRSVDPVDAERARQAELQRQAEEQRKAQELAAQRNIAAQLTALFRSYGLEGLDGDILRMVQEGKGADQITLELQDTQAYKQRFPANEARRKAGLPVLNPAEYISTERAYRQVMSAAGLPTGFYDQPEDFRRFLENDVSPTEVQSRVQVASEAINSAPPGTLDIFKKYYNEGDMVAYALDPTRALPLIERRIRAAEAGAVAETQKVGVTQGTAEMLGQQGFTVGQLQQGFGQVGQDVGSVNKLAGIYGSDVTADDLVKSTFLSDATSTEKVKKLASKERAQFGGSGAASGGSLSRNSGGQL